MRESKFYRKSLVNKCKEIINVENYDFCIMKWNNWFSNNY